MEKRLLFAIVGWMMSTAPVMAESRWNAVSGRSQAEPRIAQISDARPLTTEPDNSAKPQSVGAQALTIDTAGPLLKFRQPQVIAEPNPHVADAPGTPAEAPQQSSEKSTTNDGPATGDAAAVGNASSSGVAPIETSIPDAEPGMVVPNEAPAQPVYPAPPSEQADCDPPANVEPTPLDESTDPPSYEALAKQLGVKSTAFRDILPGESTTADLVEAWGQPASESETEEGILHLYRFDPFEKIEVVSTAGKIESMTVYLAHPLSVGDVVRQLHLGTVRPVPVPDEHGRLLGQGYPERGVLLSFAAESSPPQVGQILVDRVTAELFVLRAQYDLQQRYSKNLKDLQFALALEPANARANWLAAKIYHQTGKQGKALEHADVAVANGPGVATFDLTRAEILAASGDYQQAVLLAGKVIQDDAATGVEQAWAYRLLGDLAANGPGHDFQKASKFHLKAIDLAAADIRDPRFEIRRLAKEIQIDAHLGLGLDVALGNWFNKETAASKWFDRAEALAKDMIARDQGERALLLRVDTARLAGMTGYPEPDDPAELADQAIQHARDLIAASSDPLYKSKIEWELGGALAHAVFVAYVRRDHESSLQFADNAVALLEAAQEGRDITAVERFALGRLYFMAGSIHAIKRADHRAAISWYTKAGPLLSHPLPAAVRNQSGRTGEWLVSMGVSYWEQGDREQAIALTERGADLMKQAIGDGKLRRPALLVPFSNLASMHEQLGNTDKAKNYTELVTWIQTEEASETSSETNDE